MPPDWLHAPAAQPHDAVQFVGVAICKTAHGCHTGVLHKREDEATDLLHLAFHHRLRNERPGTEHSWVQPQIPSPPARAVATPGRLIWRRYGQDNRIPYSTSMRQISCSRGAPRFAETSPDDTNSLDA